MTEEKIIHNCECFIPGDRVLFEGEYGIVIEQYHQWVTIRFNGAGINTNWDCVYCDIAKVIG
jgi:hypothetical protein